MIENNSDLNPSFMNRPAFKIVEKKRNRSKYASKSMNRNNYTLNCEKRINEFREEFIELFDNKMQEKNVGFENYYREVLEQVQNDRK